MEEREKFSSCQYRWVDLMIDTIGFDRAGEVKENSTRDAFKRAATNRKMGSYKAKKSF